MNHENSFQYFSDSIIIKISKEEQDLPCVGISIFDADTYASSKPTSLVLGWLPAFHKRKADTISGVDTEVKTSQRGSVFYFVFQEFHP